MSKWRGISICPMRGRTGLWVSDYPENCISAKPPTSTQAARTRRRPKPSLSQTAPSSAAQTTEVSRKAVTMAASVSVKA